MIFNTLRSFPLALSLALGVGLPLQADANPIPAEQLSRLPAIQSLSMSADGKHLVALVASPTDKTGEDTALATWDLDRLDAGPTHITPSGDRMKFVGAYALKGDHLMAITRQEWTGALGGCGEGNSTGSTKTFISKAYLTDLKHSRFQEAFVDSSRKIGLSDATLRCLELAGTSSLVDLLPLDPDHVLISQLDANSFSANYLRYNLSTGRTELLHVGGARSVPGLFHPRNGDLLTREQVDPAGSDEYERRILVHDPATGQFEHHPALSQKITERYTVDIVGIDEQTGNLYVLTDKFTPHVQARVYDPARREFLPEVLAAHPDFDISGLVFGKHPSDFNQILGFRVSGPQEVVEYVHPVMVELQGALKKAFPGKDIRINNYNEDRTRVLFTVSAHDQPPHYYVLADRQHLVNLGSELPGLDTSGIGQQRWVTYSARDGRQIPAILDLPAGWDSSKGPLPAIVHPHGGPWARDYAGWDRSGWVPFLTSRGYAVLRPQYRGSAGLGRDLWIAGDSQWGLSMQDDKDDGAKWMIEQGIADPGRIAIFGYSYGGFAAAAAAVRSPSPYQCAISGAPVTDLGRLGTSWSSNRLQRILQGRTVKGMDPMQNTTEAVLPTLLFVGDRDVRTPAFHARGFYNAIRNAVPAQFEMIADMPHSGPWYPRHQRQVFDLIENYLSNDCGPDGL